MSETRISKQVHFTERVREGCPNRVQACPLCDTKSKHQYMGTPPSIEHVNLSRYGCGSYDEMDGIVQSPGCKQIAALTQRAEQLERERDELLESLHVANLAFDAIGDVGMIDPRRLAAAEAREKRLREICHDVVSHRSVWELALDAKRRRAVASHDSDNASFWNHEIGVLQRMANALLAQPSGGKEADGVKLPHPELAYKAIMARSEQLKGDSDAQ